MRIANDPERRGLSFLEFIGCLAALGGGLAIGSIYLGIDLPTAGEELLVEAGVLQPIPVEATDAESDSGTDGEATEANASADRSRLISGRPLPPTPQQISRATTAYWDQLEEILAADATLRAEIGSSQAETDVFEYLSARKEAHQETSAKLEELTTEGVDPRVLAFGMQVSRWHEAGVELFGKALDIMTEAPTAELTGPFGVDWRSAATQHKMESGLLRNRLSAVSTYIEHTYAGQDK